MRPFFPIALNVLMCLGIISGVGGCSSTPGEVRDFKTFLLEQCDSLEICFYKIEESGLNTRYKNLRIKSPTEIKKTIAIIPEKTAPRYKCGYTGSIDCFKAGKSLLEDKIEFNLHPKCCHMVFVYRGNLYSLKIPSGDAAYLRELMDKGEEKNGGIRLTAHGKRKGIKH